MSEEDRNSPPPVDVFASIGQWNPPMNQPGEVSENIGQGENHIYVTDNWDRIDEEKEPDDDDPGSLRNLLSTLEIDNPINVFKRSGREFEEVTDLEKYYDDAQKKWIGSEEFAASDQHRLPYSYYNRTVRIRFPKFSRGHKPGDFKEFIRRFVGGDRVKALGMLPFPNEWQMTLKDEPDREKLLRQKKVKIGSRNVWITPISRHEVRGMVYWLPSSTSNASIAGVLAKDGTVLFVETLDPKEKVELKHHSKGVRYFSMYLHRDKTWEDLPKFIIVDGWTGLVLVPGRPPTCFHCKQEGHMKKECALFNAMKSAREKIPKPVVGRARKEKTALVTIPTCYPSATYEGDLETSGQGDIETADRGDLGISGQDNLEKTSQGDLETTDQDDLGVADQGVLGTTDQDDLGTAVQGGPEIIGERGLEITRQDDQGVADLDDQGAAGQDDQGAADQDNKGTTGNDDQGITGQGDPEVTKNVEAMASAEDKQVVKETSVDNLDDSEKYKDVVADLQNLEKDLQHTLDETLDGLKEKMERGYKILRDLLSSK